MKAANGCGAQDSRRGAIADTPVSARPTISDWIESVPSNVKTASMSAWWRATWF